MRSRTIRTLRETMDPNPYPHKFHVTTSLPHYIDEYGVEGKVKAGDKLEGPEISLAGRIHNMRTAGPKMRFYDLHAEGKKVQIMATAQ
jgi:lysyl-tRNA synthetase class 2